MFAKNIKVFLICVLIKTRTFKKPVRLLSIDAISSASNMDSFCEVNV